MATTTEDNFHHSFICRACAKAQGGVWPKDHVATIHEGRCGYCGKQKALANIGDYDWPDNKPRGMRD